MGLWRDRDPEEPLGAPLVEMQQDIQSLYQIDMDLDVRDFMIDEGTRSQMGAHRAPREQLLLREHGGELEIALFIDPNALRHLLAHRPTESLAEHNLGDFCVVLEGVSHFVYLVMRATSNTPVSAFELELQAEVDKYAFCVLLSALQRLRPAGPLASLHQRLFQNIEFLDDLSVEERHRYRTANHFAARFARTLERRYVRTGRISRMVGELRRFYRMSARAKLDHIAKAA